jgi:hypothetical protein
LVVKMVTCSAAGTANETPTIAETMLTIAMNFARTDHSSA